MELQVTQENLAKALQTVARVASNKTTLPILSNVLFKIEDNRLVISATNLDIAVSEYIGAKVTKSGSLTIPARLIQDFVSNLPSGTVELSQEEHRLHVTSGSYNATINGTEADEFPVMPDIQNGKSWNIPAQDFKEALQQVVFTASSDEARPVLTGVLIHTKQNKLYIAATDSYRLAEKEITTQKDDISLLVPANALTDLLRIIGDETDEVRVSHDEQQVQFTVNDVQLVARLIEGNYPDYQKLIPQKFSTTTEVSKQEFSNITKVSSLFAREAAGSITVEVDEKKQEIRIQSIASQVGENTATAQATIKGSGEITLNSRYLLEALNATNGDNIEFSFNGKLDPIVIRGKKDASYTHIIMPLKS